MIYVENARKKALEFFDSADEINAEIAKLNAEYAAQQITAKIRDEKFRALDEKKRALRKKIQGDIDGLQASYVDAVQKWAALDGGKIHDDAKLLDPAFGLNGAELTELSKKHCGNVVMQRLIQNFSAKHNIMYEPQTPSPERKINAYNSLCQQLKSMTNEGDDLFNRAVIEVNEYFGSWVLQDHGEVVQEAVKETDDEKRKRWEADPRYQGMLRSERRIQALKNS